MYNFPHVDPIPLPAPVWLFKALHILTLALHFVAVQMLLGGLTLAFVLALSGRRTAMHQQAAVILSSRLPMVMTYVINLGIPPLLFAQVLYGPSLYTSNVLIGAYWIAIIPMLMLCYWSIYGFADGIAAGKNVWYKGLLAWLLAGSISRILSTNMALMLTPEDWGEMYALSGLGTRLPLFDPALTPRWLIMLFGAGWVGGFWLIWIAGRKSVQGPVKQFLSNLGGKMALVMVILQVSQVLLLFKVMPTFVMMGIRQNVLWYSAYIAWFVLSAFVLVISIWAQIKKPSGYLSGAVCAMTALLSVSAWTIIRDGIRDIILTSKGYDVWQQVVVTNWGVVVAFLLVFGLGIAALVWLVSVMMRAKPVVEGGGV